MSKQREQSDRERYIRHMYLHKNVIILREIAKKITLIYNHVHIEQYIHNGGRFQRIFHTA